MNYFVLSLIVSWIVCFSINAMGGQHETCIQKGGEYKAHYHCPDGYEAVIAGEGTLECDGECYRKGDKQSLKGAIKRIYERRFGREEVILVSDDEISKIADGLLSGKRYTVERKGISIQIRL